MNVSFEACFGNRFEADDAAVDGLKELELFFLRPLHAFYGSDPYTGFWCGGPRSQQFSYLSFLCGSGQFFEPIVGRETDRSQLLALFL